MDPEVSYRYFFVTNLFYQFRFFFSGRYKKPRRNYENNFEHSNKRCNKNKTAQIHANYNMTYQRKNVGGSKTRKKNNKTNTKTDFKGVKRVLKNKTNFLKK